MNDPQIWTLLGVFSAIMFTALGVSTRYTVSTLRAEIRAIDVKHDGRSDVLAARFDAVDARFDAVEQRLDSKIDGMEQRLESKIDGVEQRLDARIDHVAEVLGVRIDSVDHRLGAVEDDLKIVKAHLLRHPAA